MGRSRSPNGEVVPLELFSAREHAGTVLPLTDFLCLRPRSVGGTDALPMSHAPTATTRASSWSSAPSRRGAPAARRAGDGLGRDAGPRRRAGRAGERDAGPGDAPATAEQPAPTDEATPPADEATAGRAGPPAPPPAADAARPDAPAPRPRPWRTRSRRRRPPRARPRTPRRRRPRRRPRRPPRRAPRRRPPARLDEGGRDGRAQRRPRASPRPCRSRSPRSPRPRRRPTHPARLPRTAGAAAVKTDARTPPPRPRTSSSRSGACSAA